MTSEYHVNYDLQPFPARVQLVLDAHAQQCGLLSRQWYTAYTARVLCGRQIMPLAEPLAVKQGRTAAKLYNRSQTITSAALALAQSLGKHIITARLSGRALGDADFASALLLACAVGQEYGDPAGSGRETGDAELMRTVAAALPLAVIMYDLLAIKEADSSNGRALVWLFKELLLDSEAQSIGLPGLWWLAGNFQQALGIEIADGMEGIIARISSAMESYTKLNLGMQEHFQAFLARQEARQAAMSAEGGAGAAADPLPADVLTAVDDLLGSGPVCFFAGRDEGQSAQTDQFSDDSGNIYYMSWAVAEAGDLRCPCDESGASDPGYAACLEDRPGEGSGTQRGAVLSSPQAVLKLQQAYRQGLVHSYRSHLADIVRGIDHELCAQIENMQQPVLIRVIRRIYIGRSRRNLTGVRAARWMCRRGILD